MKHLIVIGPSCSGKSTIAKQISANLQMPYFSLDDFYIKDAHPIYVLDNYGNPQKTWERPYMYDGAKLAQHVISTEAVSGPCVIEGFVALQYELMQGLSAVRVYIDLAFNESLQRRKLRPRHSESDISFAAIGEQETKEFVESQKKLADVHIFNGNASIDQLVKEITTLYEEA